MYKHGILAIGQFWHLIVPRVNDNRHKARLVLAKILGLDEAILGLHFDELRIFCSFCCV